MPKVLIELEFDHDVVSAEDVYNYLYEILENECLSWEIETNGNSN
ncbi:MAG: hypothetical protein Unbinned1524contig1001_33 [Prokaryotic dsDNA virus sp.]|nr:MAG: hypothetical protein Unbinned1524contig1001_33 [Prokaryotic dsDNA virus sp.]